MEAFHGVLEMLRRKGLGDSPPALRQGNILMTRGIKVSAHPGEVCGESEKVVTDPGEVGGCF